MCYHRILWLLAFFYFRLVAFCFFLLNWPRRKRSVSVASDPRLLKSAVRLRAEFLARKLRCSELVSAFIGRILEVDPEINAVAVENFAEAMRVAEEHDRLLNSLDDEGLKKLFAERPLFGIPFTSKDSIAVEGLPITVGIPSRLKKKCTRDATVIQRMKEAGAIHLAVTNVPELLLFMETANNAYGRTRSPFDLRRSPGGSSGGEGALLAAGGAVCGLGSDIGGSVRRPAIFNGLFGWRPSNGIVPPDGHLPETFNDAGDRSQLFVMGPICRFLEDLVPALSPEKSRTLLRLDEQVDLSSLDFFYLENFGGATVIEPPDAAMRASLQKALRALEERIGKKATRIAFADLEAAFGICLASLAAPEGPSFAEHLADGEGSVDLWPEIAKGLLGLSEHTLPALLQALLEKTFPMSPQRRAELLSRRERLRGELLALLGERGVLLLPGFAHSARFHGHSYLTLPNVAYTAIWNALRVPTLACPTGRSPEGLPTAVQLVAAPFADRLLLATARILTDHFGATE
uniref:Amidase domain-containing protein n=1 Tax=Steinernema glaseri TaxID=37863 RepID=A0A1I7YSX2_9BILA